MKKTKKLIRRKSISHSPAKRRLKRDVVEWGTINPVLLVIFILVLVGGGVFAYKQFKTPARPTVSQMRQKKVLPGTGVIRRRSKAPGVIQQITMVSQIDASGKAVLGASTNVNGDTNGTVLAAQTSGKTFSRTGAIYAVLALNSPKPGTNIEYVEYKNGRYVSHKGMTVTKPNTQNGVFQWNVKPGATRRPGKIRLKFYTNGKLERATEYAIQ